MRIQLTNPLSSSTTSSPTSASSGNTSGNTPSGTSTSGSTSKATRIASTEGAFNGTSFATLTENISTEPLLHLFYQNYTGQVQQAVRAPGGSWTGGDSNITTDARGATPLAAVNYTSNGNLTVRPRPCSVGTIRINNSILDAYVLHQFYQYTQRED